MKSLYKSLVIILLLLCHAATGVAQEKQIEDNKKIAEFFGPLPPEKKITDKAPAEEEIFGPLPPANAKIVSPEKTLEQKPLDKKEIVEEKFDPNEIVKIKPELFRIKNYLRFNFNSEKKNDVTVKVDGNALFLDFERPNDIDFFSLVNQLDELKSVGVSEKSKQLTLYFKNKISKVKKFISDGNNFGFDLYLAKKAYKKNYVFMTPILGTEPVAQLKSDGSRMKIVTYPKEYIGPPRIEQISLFDADFVGPYLYDPREYSVFEIEKTKGENEIIPEIIITENNALIIFPIDESDKLGAAVYKEDHIVQIFFDKKKLIQNFNFPDNSFFKNIKTRKSNEEKPEYTNIEVLVNSTKSGTLFYKNKQGWVFEITKNSYDKSFSVNQIKTSFENNQGEKKIVFKSKQFSKPIITTSKTTGVTYKVFTSTENGFGNNMNRSLVDITIKPSLQGLLIEEKSDFLSYNQKDSDILSITKLPNIQLSDEVLSTGTSDVAGSASRSRSAGVFPEKSLFPFTRNLKYLASLEKANIPQKKTKALEQEEVKLEEPEINFQEKTFEMLNKIIAEDDIEKKADLKFELGKYLFSKGLYAEAAGSIKDIFISNPKYKKSYDAKAVLAASLYLTKKYDNAYELFTELADQSTSNVYFNELKLWQYLSKLSDNNENKLKDKVDIEVDFVSSFDKFMQRYPKQLRLELTLLFIKELIADKKYDEVINLMEVATYKGVPKTLKKPYKLVEANMAEIEKDFDKAKEIYQELAADKHSRKFRAYGLFHKTKLTFEQGEISMEKAIENMMKAQVIWRDDFFEIDVLDYVGKLYAQAQDYEKALDAWKVISANFTDTPESIFVLGRMKDVFVKLFDEGIAYSLAPLEALKVYFKFRDLTPVGEVGDRITRKVSEFFADTDMVDEAIKIIDHQIKFRSKGDDKAGLILWLSDTLINNRNLDRALEILERIKGEKISSEIERKFKYTKAIILAKQNNTEEALELLKGDASKEADEVRAEVFWKRENWFGLIRIMENIKIPEWEDSAPKNLSKAEMKDMMRLAVAYSAQNMAQSLDNLYNKFIKRIDRKDDEFVFSYLTKPRVPLDYNQFEQSLQLDETQDFLKDYSFLPQKSWRSVVAIIAPKLKTYANTPVSQLSSAIKKDVVKLALAYSMIEPRDGKEELEIKKAFSELTRNFKDVRVDRFTIDALEVLDSRAFPKNNDAIFEGKIKLSEMRDFINYYKSSSRISQLNISTREKFKN